MQTMNFYLFHDANDAMLCSPYCKLQRINEPLLLYRCGCGFDLKRFDSQATHLMFAASHFTCMKSLCNFLKISGCSFSKANAWVATRRIIIIIMSSTHCMSSVNVSLSLNRRGYNPNNARRICWKATNHRDDHTAFDLHYHRGILRLFTLAWFQ